MKLRYRYVLVGIWNSLFGVSSFYMLSIAFVEWRDLVVLAFSYVISVVQAHIAQRKYVWGSNSSYLPELARFASAYILQFFINSALLVLSEMWFPADREIRQTIIVVLLTTVFYFVNKKGVFHVTK